MQAGVSTGVSRVPAAALLTYQKQEKMDNAETLELNLVLKASSFSANLIRNESFPFLMFELLLFSSLTHMRKQTRTSASL